MYGFCQATMKTPDQTEQQQKPHWLEIWSVSWYSGKTCVSFCLLGFDQTNNLLRIEKSGTCQRHNIVQNTTNLKPLLLRHLYHRTLKKKKVKSLCHIWRRQMGNHQFVLLKNVPKREWYRSYMKCLLPRRRLFNLTFSGFKQLQLSQEGQTARTPQALTLLTWAGAASQ